MLPIFFLGCHITAIFLRPFSFFFSPLFISIEDKRNKLQVIYREIKSIHTFCISLMTVDVKENAQIPLLSQVSFKECQQ